jgi:adenylate cyclase
MEFRIGINLGDVIDEEDRIYGDGVNIAARLEALADPGGICISKTAFDQIELGYEFLGEQDVKNIAKPVGAYKVLMDAEAVGKVIGEVRPKTKQMRWAAVGALAVLIIGAGALVIWNFYLRPAFEPASVERMAFPLPDKPSIVVLPFANMSGDPEDDYICDAISMNIISALSNILRIFVIARDSAFTYKGKPVKVHRVSEELGVRYVLKGGIQKSGDRLRATAQLIDAITGRHMWSEKYDRKMRDLFDLQDEITKKIVVSLQVELIEGEGARLKYRTTDNLQAWAYAVKGHSLFLHLTKEDNIKARELLERAVDLDPEYAWAWTALAWTYYVDSWVGWTKSRTKSFKRATELARKALALDDSLSMVHILLENIYLKQRQYDKAIAEGEKAIALAPAHAGAHFHLGRTLLYAGRPEEAISLIQKAMRLHPYYPAAYLATLGYAYGATGRYEEELTTAKQCLDRSLKGEYNPVFAHLALSVVYIELGRETKARAHVEEALKIDPSWSLQRHRKLLLYRNSAVVEQRLEVLRKAGLPETPPLPLPDKPSIAVLPFVNMSGDPEQEYFSDGITEEIITALSKTPKLFVIARTSSFKYKGKKVDVRRVGRELGVRYVLEGSVRKSEDRLRVTAQLVDANTGHHLWADRWDREPKDIFAIQDEITRKIIVELQVKLTMGEHARVYGTRTNNLKAYLKVLQARKYLNQVNKEDNVRARQLAEQAIALDPEYAGAYVALGFSHYIDFMYRATKSPELSLARASEIAHKALAIDDSSGGARIILSNIYLLKRQHEKAIAELEQALELAPSSARVHMWLGRALCYAGRPAEAIHLLEKVLCMDPMPGTIELNTLGRAYRDVGQYDEAIATCKKAIKIAPKNQWAHLTLTSAYSLSGREQEARAQAAEVLKVNPKFSLAYFAKTSNYKNQADTERIVSALRKAGLK